MGGGDLNSKKSWHPNTMKNQERVWKAEQAAAQEKKRIQELQREHAEERDRYELNNMIKQNANCASGSNDDNRLHWMYDKPDRKVQQEDYLLGKSIEKNNDNEKKEQEIPAVARRVIGSSMLSSAGDAQVDVARKLREDPLLLVKERERAARAALLNNPLQRKRLTELLRKEQEQKKDHKSKKKTNKKDKDLDKQLAAKLTALGGEKGLNLATLLATDDSDSDSSSSEEEKYKKKKKKQKSGKSKKREKKRKKKKQSSSSESSEDERNRLEKRHSREASRRADYEKNKQTRKRKSDNDSSDCDGKYKKRKSYGPDEHGREDREIESDRASREDVRKRADFRSDRNNRRDEGNRRGKGMSEEERAAKLAEMAAAGAERERARGRRVAEQRAAAAREPAARARAPEHAPARTLPDSLEARIHSNRHYIQRDRRHMDEHFARR